MLGEFIFYFFKVEATLFTFNLKGKQDKQLSQSKRISVSL